jgi:hypothetical protein
MTATLHQFPSARPHAWRAGDRVSYRGWPGEVLPSAERCGHIEVAMAGPVGEYTMWIMPELLRPRVEPLDVAAAVMAGERTDDGDGPEAA